MSTNSCNYIQISASESETNTCIDSMITDILNILGKKGSVLVSNKLTVFLKFVTNSQQQVMMFFQLVAYANRGRQIETSADMLLGCKSMTNVTCDKRCKAMWLMRQWQEAKTGSIRCSYFDNPAPIPAEKRGCSWYSAEVRNARGLMSESAKGIPAVRWACIEIFSRRVWAWSCIIRQLINNNMVIRFILRRL